MCITEALGRRLSPFSGLGSSADRAQPRKGLRFCPAWQSQPARCVLHQAHPARPVDRPGGLKCTGSSQHPSTPGEEVPAGPAGGAATVNEAVSGLLVPAFLLQGLAQSTGSGTWRTCWCGFARCLTIFKQKQ